MLQCPVKLVKGGLDFRVIEVNNRIKGKNRTENAAWLASGRACFRSQT